MPNSIESDREVSKKTKNVKGESRHQTSRRRGTAEILPTRISDREKGNILSVTCHG
jgi:hypothetical protein